MSIEVASRHMGVLNPNEMSMLQQVFDEACGVLCADAQSELAGEIARETLSAYKYGIRNKSALLAAIVQSRRARSR